MEAETQETEKTPIKEEKRGKRKCLRRFLNFLMYGGRLLIVVFIAGIITLISVLSK